jgi:DNA invertase Pin-like site-specific DNA recombinase
MAATLSMPAREISIQEKGLTIVVVDQPMTHQALAASQPELSAIQQALTSFMLDLGAAMARDDYETRQKRQKQGIAKAKEEGKYKGKQINAELHKNIQSSYLTVFIMHRYDQFSWLMLNDKMCGKQMWLYRCIVEALNKKRGNYELQYE